jgi:hypothetical protein
MDRITPSEFRQVFRFENFDKTQKPSSGYDEAFKELFTTKGRWRQLSAGRAFALGLDLITTTYEVTCYWRAQLEELLTKDTRLIYENKIFKIERIQLINEQRKYYQFIVIGATN